MGEPPSLLRPGLLEGRAVRLTGGDALQEPLQTLGAEIVRADDASLHGLVHDARASFGVGGRAGLERVLEEVWSGAGRAAAETLVPAGKGGRIVLVAPAAGSGEHARAAADGLENLARTLSVEWARHGITTVAVVPGSSTGEAELGALVGFVLSEAGGYLSGCRLSLA